MFDYYGEDRVLLRFKVKADSLEDASGVAAGYDVKSVSECGEKDMEGVFDVEVALKPADLEKLFGKPSSGVSIAKAYKMAKAAHEKHEAAMKGGAMDMED